VNATIRFHQVGHDWLFRIGKLRLVAGINSTLRDGNHVLFWEFDDQSYPEVRGHLEGVQHDFALPDIVIFKASTMLSWHAMCFARLSWRTAITVVAATEGIDLLWFKMSLQRDHWTLRVTDKGNGAPERYAVLEGAPPEATHQELVSAVLYEAWQRGSVAPDG